MITMIIMITMIMDIQIMDTVMQMFNDIWIEQIIMQTSG